MDRTKWRLNPEKQARVVVWFVASFEVAVAAPQPIVLTRTLVVVPVLVSFLLPLGFLLGLGESQQGRPRNIATHMQPQTLNQPFWCHKDTHRHIITWLINPPLSSRSSRASGRRLRSSSCTCRGRVATTALPSSGDVCCCCCSCSRLGTANN